MQTLHALDVTRQSLLLRGNRQAASMAKAVVAPFQLVVERNALVKHETLPLPTAVLLRNLFEVAKNASAQMMDFAEL